MKVVVRLAILVATLLLVSNMAFAATQCAQMICYDIFATKTNGSVDHEGIWQVCLNNNGSGQLCDDDSCMGLYLFGGGPGWFNSSGAPAFGGMPNWSAWIVNGTNVSGFLQPIGEGGSPNGVLINGILYDEGDRDVLNGIKVPCPCPTFGQTKCSGQCKDLLNDPTNCGTCGNVCSQGLVCIAGACTGV